MTNAEILKEIEMLEAHADSIKIICYKLRENLGLVSTRPTSKKAQIKALSATIIANMNKTMLKKPKR